MELYSDEGSMMRNRIVFLVAVTLIAGCAVVKINHGETDSVTHAGGEEKGKELANLACRKAKAVRAEVISTVPKEGAAQDDKERYVTTFRCLY